MSQVKKRKQEMKNTDKRTKINTQIPENPEQSTLPEITFVTSWDDGSIRDLVLAELLAEFGLKGIFYVVVDWVGQEGYLTWKDIRALDENPLFRIGSHTMSHPMDLKMLYEEELFYEIQNSKDLIETVLGHQIIDFCYPRGRHNDTVRHLVARSGYLKARTTLVGHDSEGSDQFQIPTTVHVYDGRPEYRQKDWYTYAVNQFDQMLENPEGKVFHLWGHANEIHRDQELPTLRRFLEYASSKAKLVPQKEV